MFTTDSDTGTYAEYTLTKPKNTYQLADNISFEEGSGIGIPYFTVKFDSIFTLIIDLF